MLEVTRAEAKAVRIFIVGAGCLKMPKTVALKTGLPIAGMVRLQWGKSELAIQDPICADFIHQLSPAKHSFCFLREGGLGWVWSGSSRRDGDFPKFSEVTVNVGDKFQHS